MVNNRTLLTVCIHSLYSLFPKHFLAYRLLKYVEIPLGSQVSDQFCIEMKQPKNCSAMAWAIAFLVTYVWSIMAMECSRFVLKHANNQMLHRQSVAWFEGVALLIYICAQMLAVREVHCNKSQCTDYNMHKNTQYPENQTVPLKFNIFRSVTEIFNVTFPLLMANIINLWLVSTLCFKFM